MLYQLSHVRVLHRYLRTGLESIPRLAGDANPTLRETAAAWGD